MIIIERILGKIEDFDTKNIAVDKVLLDHYDMAKPHQKLTSEGGMKLAVSLENERLFNGAVLYKDEEKLVAVELLPEDVLEIHPKGNMQWGETAFNIGNMHHPAFLEEDCIVVPYDKIIETMLEGIGVEFKRCQRQLTGKRANHTTGAHSHSHGHSHDHLHEHHHD